jgi:hypothetical protein
MGGRWEVAACLSSSFEKEVEEQVSDERERAVDFALRDACEASLKGVSGAINELVQWKFGLLASCDGVGNSLYWGGY